MTQTVTIIKSEKVFKVHFMYNNDLVDIMRKHKGWWIRYEKCWQFPLWKFEEFYDDLTNNKYKVEIRKED
ncbi:unnamed protein product, partial [marine sediment metagenome]